MNHIEDVINNYQCTYWYEIVAHDMISTQQLQISPLPISSLTISIDNFTLQFYSVRSNRLFNTVRSNRLFNMVRSNRLFNTVRSNRLLNTVRSNRLFNTVRSNRLFNTASLPVVATKLFSCLRSQKLNEITNSESALKDITYLLSNP